MRIEESTVLVTGGSSGLGAACVERFVRAGARVLVVDTAPPSNEWVRERAEHVHVVPADVTREFELQAALEAGTKRFGSLRAAIACAGVLHAERLLGRSGPASLPDFRRVVDVNLSGTFNTVRLAAAAIAQSEPDADGQRGVIVLTSSVAAFDGQIGQAAYAASKGGVAAMVLPLARELGPEGIRVVGVAPGAFDTPMMQAAPDRVRRSLIDQTPYPHRLGDPDEFAALVCHVLENRMLNGCILRLDGALRMAPR